MKISTKGRYALRLMLDLAEHRGDGFVALKDLTEGSLAPVACLVQHPNTCERADECPTLFIWEGLNKVISDYLDSITLQDIIDRQNESYSNNYII